jgi:hypothetical protein
MAGGVGIGVVMTVSGKKGKKTATSGNHSAGYVLWIRVSTSCREGYESMYICAVPFHDRLSIYTSINQDMPTAMFW